MATKMTRISGTGAEKKAPALPLVGSTVTIEAVKPFCGKSAGDRWRVKVSSAVLETLKEGLIKIA